MIHARDHQTPCLFDPWDYLGPKRRKLLTEPWADVFQEHILRELPVDKWGRSSIVDTKLLCCELFFIEPSFKGRRRKETQSGLFSLPVVENLNVLCDIPYGLLSGFMAAVVDQFTFQDAPEAFHWGVVVAIPLSAHGCRHSAVIKQ